MRTHFAATGSADQLDRSLRPQGAIARFRAAFDELPERERKVALLLHVNNLTLRKAGEVLGVSESRVCQTHGQLKRGLRARLQPDAELFLEVA
jgi:RNA polymerase sigma factor for flagellar operon FliA